MEDIAYISLPKQLPQIQGDTVALNFGMASEPLIGALLRTLAASKPCGRLLELGTGTGLATAWLLNGMDQSSTLISVDSDAAVQIVAQRALGADPRLKLINCDALEFVATRTPQSFDLIFADAMAGKYEGLDLALDLVKPGGFYVIDDMLPQPNWPDGHSEKIPVLMEQLARRTDFEFVPMRWATGLVITVRKS